MNTLTLQTPTPIPVNLIILVTCVVAFLMIVGYYSFIETKSYSQKKKVTLLTFTSVLIIISCLLVSFFIAHLINLRTVRSTQSVNVAALEETYDVSRCLGAKGHKMLDAVLTREGFSDVFMVERKGIEYETVLHVDTNGTASLLLKDKVTPFPSL